MALPKVIYENLPYIYLVVSGGLLSLGDSWPLIFSAAIFYMVACIVLVTRSSHRRVDKDKEYSLNKQLPELFYEYLPYIYAAIGLFMLMSQANNILKFIGFILIVWALRNLLCRHSSRTKKSTGLF